MKYNANKIMFIENWARKANPKKKYAAIQTNKMDDGKWECEVDLPIINKIVRKESYDLITLVIDSANKAYQIINEFVKKNPEYDFEYEQKNKKWELYPDKDTVFIPV